MLIEYSITNIPQFGGFGTVFTIHRDMKSKKINTKQQTVSQIVRTIDKDGGDVLGFTVYSAEGSFYNVLRRFTVDDYEEVYKTLMDERRQILTNKQTKE